jgi:hypothetical protein
MLFDRPEEVEEDDHYQDNYTITPDEEDAILNGDLFAEDYADEIFTETFVSLDHDRDPFGWDITDTIDWESLDYE